MIPHDEGALGMEDGSTRDIALLTRVGQTGVLCGHRF